MVDTTAVDIAFAFGAFAALTTLGLAAIGVFAAIGEAQSFAEKRLIARVGAAMWMALAVLFATQYAVLVYGLPVWSFAAAAGVLAVSLAPILKFVSARVAVLAVAEVGF
ncbi:MAG: hypothetical protein AAGC95_10675 [Pseudomonadota bacterium]